MPNPQNSNRDDQIGGLEEDRIRGIARDEDELEDTEDLGEDETDEESEDTGDV